MDVDVKVVRFAESINRSKEEKGRALFRKRKGKTMSRARAEFSLTSTPRAYEALKQVDKREDLLRVCEENKVVEAAMLFFFEELWEGFDGDNVAEGLARLHSNDRPPPSFVNLSDKSKEYLLSIATLCPDLLRQQDGSSIASAATDGTLYTVELNHDETEELGAMRVAMAAAFDVAKTRGMDKEDFDTEARKMFRDDTEDYQKTFEFVVPDDFVPQENEDGATADSHFDAIWKAAANAFTNWCKNKRIGTFERLVMKVFKPQV